MKKERKKTLREILRGYLQEHADEWVHGGMLEKVAQSYGYEGETAKRELRRFCNSPLNINIIKSFQNRSVKYKWVERNQKQSIQEKLL